MNSSCHVNRYGKKTCVHNKFMNHNNKTILIGGRKHKIKRLKLNRYR